MSEKRGFFSYVQLQRIFWLLLALSFFAACDACNPWPKCGNDSHCRADKADNPNKKNFFCINGKCEECRTVNDCENPKKQKCEGHRCVEKTCADISCPGGQRCNPDTLECKWICEQDGENPCDGDRCKVCKNHQCVPKPPKCTRDADCAGAHEICKNAGTCDAVCEGGCSSAKPCQPGYKCQGNMCVLDQCTPEMVHFDLDKSRIRSDAQEILRKNLDCFNRESNKAKKILIEGHADERGTREYNLQLGKRRALSIKRYLSGLGIPKSRMCTVSKGKEEPLIPHARTEEEHQKNRRGVFKFVDSCN